MTVMRSIDDILTLNIYYEIQEKILPTAMFALKLMELWSRNYRDY